MPEARLSPRDRRTVLQQLSRDRLDELTTRFELEVGDRRSIDAHVGAIVRKRSLDFRRVLDVLRRDGLQAACEALGLDTGGREKATLVARIMDWLTRLETGKVSEVQRPVIMIPLSGEPGEVARRNARYGDFSKMNNRWYASASDATHARLAENPEEWGHYHTMYRQLRETWTVVPYKEEIRWLSEPEREGLVVGDFGCGEAFIAAAVSDRHEVHSFDHVAINEKVIACDIAHVPLKSGALDVAIFCLSLMGANFTDYIREAHRCLHLDGRLHIWEPASYFEDVGKFCSRLGRLGFDVMAPETEGAFVRIAALRNAKKPDPTLVLPFRGHGQ